MKIPLLLLVLFLSIKGYTQYHFGPSEVAFDKNVFYIELMGGFVLPSMVFNETPFDDYTSKNFTGQTEGLGVRLQNTKHFSYAALVAYRAQGINFPDYPDYVMHSNYLNLYMPVEFSYDLLNSKRKASPAIFAFAGPYASYYLGGDIKIGKTELALTSQEIRQWDFGAEAGIGFRVPTFSVQGRSNLNLKCSYYRGLISNFPVSLPDYTDEQLNQFLLSKSGTRFNHGIRVSICYEISLQRQKVSTFTAGGDGKRTYKRFLVF